MDFIFILNCSELNAIFNTHGLLCIMVVECRIQETKCDSMIISSSFFKQIMIMVHSDYMFETNAKNIKDLSKFHI